MVEHEKIIERSDFKSIVYSGEININFPLVAVPLFCALLIL